jgi:hypothetical protein
MDKGFHAMVIRGIDCIMTLKQSNPIDVDASPTVVLMNPTHNEHDSRKDQPIRIVSEGLDKRKSWSSLWFR